MSRTTRILTVVALALGTAIAAPTISSAAPTPDRGGLDQHTLAGGPASVTDGTGSSSAVAACVTFEDQTTNATNFHTTQQVSGSACKVGSKYTLTVQIFFVELRSQGFNASHVTGCSAHFQLTHIGGSTQDKPVTCTTNAQTKDRFSITQTWTGIGPGTYRVAGWVNIQAGTAHYEAYPYRSETPNFRLP